VNGGAWGGSILLYCNYNERGWSLPLLRKYLGRHKGEREERNWKEGVLRSERKKKISTRYRCRWP